MNSDRNLQTKEIFVIGAPRSGTSFLARSLAHAKDTIYLEETGMFSLFGVRRAPILFGQHLPKQKFNQVKLLRHLGVGFLDKLRGRNRLDDLVTNILRHTKLSQHDLNPSARLIDVQNCILSKDELLVKNELVCKLENEIKENGIFSFFHSLFDDLRLLTSKKIIIEKTPTHIEFVPVITKIFPDAKFVLIIRDKRECVASFMTNFSYRYGHNRFLSRTRILKNFCRTCNYYSHLEDSLKFRPDVFTLGYVEFINATCEKIQEIAYRFNLIFDYEKMKKTIPTSRPNSKWQWLSRTEQKIINATLISSN